jgi:transketolase
MRSVPLQSAEVTAAKLKAIGFTVSSIDGHNPAQVQAAFDAHARNQAGDGKPFAIVATTIKGWGAAAMQQGNQHGSAMKADKVEHIMAELTATSGHLGAAWVPGDLRLAPITNTAPTPAEPASIPTFTEAMKQFDRAGVLTTGKLATRKAYGVALRALGRANPQVVAIDCDVRGSTFACDFADDRELASRFIDGRIAEQNMVSVAAGLGKAGKIPFASHLQ